MSITRTVEDESFHVQERVDGYWQIVRSAPDIDTAAARAAEHIAKRTEFFPVRIVKVVTTTTVTTEVIPL